MRLVEELAQGLDVDVLVPAHHEDAGGAGRCIPAACKVGSRQGSAAGPGPTRSGPELSRDPGPTSSVEPRLAHQHLSGAPLEAQLPGGRVGAGHHLRERAVGASGRAGHPRDPPPGSPRSPSLPSPPAAAPRPPPPCSQPRSPPALREAPARLPEPLPAAARGGSAAASPQRRRSGRGTRRAPASARPPPRLLRGARGRRRGRSPRMRRRLRKAPAGRERAEGRRGRAEGGVAGLRGVFALGCLRRFSRAGGGWIRPQQRSTRSLGRPRCFAPPPASPPL